MREWVEHSDVWKTVWKSEIQNTTKSPGELVESSAVWKTVWKSEFQNVESTSNKKKHSPVAVACGRCILGPS